MKWNVIVWVLVFLALMGCESKLPHETSSINGFSVYKNRVQKYDQMLRDSKKQAELVSAFPDLPSDLIGKASYQFEESGKWQIFVESLKVAELKITPDGDFFIHFDSREIKWSPKGNLESDRQDLLALLSVKQGANSSVEVAGFGAFLDHLYPESAQNIDAHKLQLIVVSALLFLGSGSSV
ncbi:hypothetical protein GW915_06815 [bacterium]|nr:hypothetical protein [bacterium]